MKKSIKFSLLALVMAGAVACNDDDDNTTEEPKGNSELIIGTWNGVTMETYEYDSTTGDTIQYDEDNLVNGGVVYTFDEDNTFTTFYMGDTSEGTYTLDGTELAVTVMQADTVAYEDKMEILELDESNLKGRTVQSDSLRTTEQTVTFTKQ